MANPTKLAWSGPLLNVDDTTFTAAQYAGFELEIRRGPEATQVAVPVAWRDDGQYEFPLTNLGIGYGVANVRMRTVAVGGLVSEWTNEVILTLAAPPGPPTNLRAL